MSDMTDQERQALSATLQEDCQVLLAIASFAVELKDYDSAILIADKLASASPNMRDAHAATALFRLMNNEIEQADKLAGAMTQRFPDWSKGKVLHALTQQLSGGLSWSADLLQVIDEIEDEEELAFARLVLES